MKSIKMPKMGITMTSAVITSWKKNIGESVNQGEPLYEIETEKSTITVESPYTGVLKEIIVPEGESADVDAVLATIEE